MHNPIKIMRSWVSTPGFPETAAKSTLATALLLGVILALHAAS